MTDRSRHELLIDEDPVRRIIDRRVPWAIHGEVYSQQCFGTGPAPDQGWKLHVAATRVSAVDVLEAALDVLFAEGARFKVTSSIELLDALNAGHFGLSQIGKFIAVYPSDDAQAVRLALELDEATRGHPGPRVPSDRSLRPGSLVHYRYGAMGLRPEAAATGETGAYDLLDPAGRLTSDVRLNFYLAPQGIPDPFEAAGAYVPRPPRGRLLNERYLVVDALWQSPRGGVFRAVDLVARPTRLCLLKEYWHDVSVDEHGRDARDWGTNEERILSRHAGDPHLPRFFDSFELDGDRYVAIEYVEGTPLDRLLSEEYTLTDTVRPSDVIAIGLATADALAHLHAIGLVFRDFKPGNVIKTPEGGYRLIDFGIAYEDTGDGGCAIGLGTPHFCSPEQFDGEDPAPADDVFAWGAVLHHLACGEASLSDMPEDPNRQRPLRRKRVRELNAGFPASVGAVIDRAVSWERSQRYATMGEARNALREAARKLTAGPVDALTVMHDDPAGTDGGTPAPVLLTSSDALRLACEVGDALCGAAEERGGGLCWTTGMGLGDQVQRSPDLYSGAAGVGLFLAELAHVTGHERYAEAARGAARWLMGPVWGRGWAQHGLHGGEPGVACFFLRLAELFDEPDYVTAAELRMRRLRDVPFVTVDLFHGTAGTVLSLLRLHAITGDSGYLADARLAGDQIARAAIPAPDKAPGCYWEVASPDPGGATAPYLGLLHGAAGMGLAMAHLAQAANEEHYLGVAKGAAELLLAQARDARAAPSGGGLSEGGGLVWPRQLGDATPGMQAHCHGAGGIGQFLLRLDRLAPDARYREAARGAAHTVAARGERESQSCVCHGLGGTVNVLLDAHQALCDSHWLARARQCGGHLQRFRGAEQAGTYAMSVGGRVSADLMLGYAGVGSVLLRLADPESAPDLLLP